MKEDYYVFREASSLTELKTLLQLRYKVFCESNLQQFVKCNEYGIDIDCFDLRAHHFGLFKNDTLAIGYLRVIEDDENLNQDIILLANQFPVLATKIYTAPAEPFPLMTYFPDADIVCKAYREIKNMDEKIVEVSRLSILREYRSFGLARHIAESAMAFGYFCHNIKHAMLACNLSHKRLYSEFGFNPLEGTNEYIISEQPSAVLFGSLNLLPNNLRARLIRMAEPLQKTGKICYYSHDRENFYLPSRSATIPLTIAIAA